MEVILQAKSVGAMHEIGRKLGSCLTGGEVIVLVGDVGAGKTVLTKGIAQGMGIHDTIQSPTFTISRLYPAPHDRRLAHYDFYRLSEPGVMREELQEVLHDASTVVVIEWADIVTSVIDTPTLVITIISTQIDERELMVAGEPEYVVSIQAEDDFESEYEKSIIR